jgi:hypothetical protein
VLCKRLYIYRPVRSAYQPPASSTFLSEQIVLFSQNKSAPAISQTNRLYIDLTEKREQHVARLVGCAAVHTSGLRRKVLTGIYSQQKISSPVYRDFLSQEKVRNEKPVGLLTPA